MHTILVVVCVILIIICLFMLHDEYRRRRAAAAMARAGGGADPAALEALENLNQLARPTPFDRFQRAEIQRFNLLNNETHRAPPRILQGILGDYLAAVVNPMPLIPARFAIRRVETIDIGDDIDDIDGIGALIAALDLHTPRARAADIQQRQAEAIANTDTKIEAIHEFLESSTRYTNDSQNVHDSKTNVDLRRALKLIDTPVNISAMFDDAHAYIASTDDTNVGKQYANGTLQKMAEGNYLSSLDISEDRLFALVWNRSLIPQNASRKSNIQEAIYLALKDCWEHGNIVCINGRCGKVLGSLALIDYDPSISIMNYESYRNQIYRETLDIIDFELDAAGNSDDQAMVEAADAYYSTEDVPETPAMAKLRTQIRKAIDKNIDAYDNLTLEEKNKIREECYISAIL